MAQLRQADADAALCDALNGTLARDNATPWVVRGDWSRPVNPALTATVVIGNSTGRPRVTIEYIARSPITILWSPPGPSYELVLERRAQRIAVGIDADVDAGQVAQLVDLAGSRTSPRWNLPFVLALPAAVSRVRTGAVSDPGLMVAVVDTEAAEDAEPQLVVVDSAQAARLDSERWVKLIKRVDAALMSLLQRVALAARRTATSPTRPPGDIVVSSARLPRGPNAATDSSPNRRGALLAVA